MGRNQLTTSNGPNGLSFSAVKLGNAEMVYWIQKVDAFERLPVSAKYNHFLQKYNILPGQRRR